MIQNLYLEKTCYINFQLNSSECTAQHNHTSETGSEHATEIQKYVSNLNIYGSLIENIPSVILVLFLGPWSEKNGRKPPMLAPLVGHLCSVSLYILNYYFTSWPAEYILFASIPCGLFGGSATLLMALNRYSSYLMKSTVSGFHYLIYLNFTVTWQTSPTLNLGHHAFQ